jgi:hypothetical protein
MTLARSITKFGQQKILYLPGKIAVKRKEVDFYRFCHFLHIRQTFILDKRFLAIVFEEGGGSTSAHKTSDQIFDSSSQRLCILGVCLGIPFCRITERLGRATGCFFFCKNSLKMVDHLIFGQIKFLGYLRNFRKIAPYKQSPNLRKFAQLGTLFEGT